MMRAHGVRFGSDGAEFPHPGDERLPTYVLREQVEDTRGVAYREDNHAGNYD